LFLNIS
jgi:hypothetical protein